MEGAMVQEKICKPWSWIDSGWPVVFSQFQSTLSARMEEHGFESTQIADVLKAKGKGADGSWLWCTTDDSVYDAVKSSKEAEQNGKQVAEAGSHSQELEGSLMQHIIND